MDTQNDITYFQSCLLCGSKKLKALAGHENDHVCTCNTCGFAFSKRIPTEQELADNYAGYLRNDQIPDITLKRYDELLARLEKYRLNNAIIDIGAGDGQLIGRAKQKDWNTYATEYEDRSVELCRKKGIVTHKGKLDPANYQEGSFDVILSVEVIEHINNPLEEVRNFHKILRKGGVVYVTTPNFNSLTHRLLKGEWSVINYPEHLCYYTPRTLEKLFKEAGFKKIAMETTRFLPRRLSQPINAGSAKATKTTGDEALRNKTETRLLWKLLKKAVNTCLTITKTGDDMKAMFVKL